MAAILETVNRFRKIEEATAPKDDPAPVYLLDEIADMTRQSPEAAQAVADAVQKKLGVKSPIVKFKALRIIKHLCTKGCSQFQRCMQRHSAAVRELIHWRGEPDPFKGDVPNARVREFAKEVVEVLFNSTPVTNSTNTLAAQGKIQGFGSGGETSTSTYSGIGSSGIGSSGSASGRFASASNSSSGVNWPHGLTGLVAAQQAASQITRSAQQALGEGPIAQGIANAANALGGLLQPQGYGSRLNDSPYKDNNGHNNGNADFGYASGGSYAAPTVTANQVLGSEEALVDDITAPGGLRPLPDAADLRRFVDTMSSMDGLRIAELLRAKMESLRWQIVLKSLAALEAILQRGSTQACGEVAVMFQSDSDPIKKCLQSQQQQVQQLAAAVLKLLLGEDVTVPAAAAAGGRKGVVAGKSAAAAAPVADLLLDDSPGPAAAAAPASGVDLLGDLMGPEPAAAAAARSSTADALLDGLGSDPVPAAAAAGADDLFGGLNVEAVPAAAAAPAGLHTTASTAAAAAAARTTPAAAAGSAPAAAGVGGSKPNNAPLDELFAGISTSNTSNLLGIGNSPVQLQQQPVGRGLPQQQQQQQQPLGLQQQQQPLGLQQQQQQGFAGQPDLLGGFSSPVKQPGFGMQGSMQPQQYGLPGLGIPQQQQWGVPSQAGLGGIGSGNFTAPTNVGQHQQLQRERSGSGSGAAGGWKSHITASEAAFDFVFDEFKKH